MERRDRAVRRQEASASILALRRSLLALFRPQSCSRQGEIARHARRGFPPNVSARTVHSRAYASVAPALTARVNLPAEPPHEFNVTKPAKGWRPTASSLLSPGDQPPNEYPDAQGHPGCRPWTLMHITIRQLRRFLSPRDDHDLGIGYLFTSVLKTRSYLTGIKRCRLQSFIRVIHRVVGI